MAPLPPLKKKMARRPQPAAVAEPESSPSESESESDTPDSNTDAEETIEVVQRSRGGKKKKKPVAVAASDDDDFDDAPGPSSRGRGQNGTKNRGAGGGKKGRGRGRRNNDSGSDDGDDDDDDDGENNDRIKTMVIGVVREILLANSNKTITTKASIVKNQMDGKRKLFVKIIRDAQEVLDEVYGIKVVTLDKDKESLCGYTSNLDNSSTHFFSTSIFSTMSVAEFNDCINVKIENAEHLLLTSILSIIFMKFLDVGVRGEILWDSVMVKLDLADKLNVKQADFHRYIKKEFIDIYYLTATADRDDNDEIFYRYNWGPRAHLEFSKTEMLLYTAKLLDVPFFSFHTQLKSISDELSQEEFDKFLADNMDQNQNSQRFSRMFRNRDRDAGDEPEELFNV